MSANRRAHQEPLARPSKADDPRTQGPRLADALVALAEMALNGGDLPQTAVARPHVLLITTPNDLHGTPGADPSLLDGAGPISPDTARQVCCHTDITPIAVGRNGHILDVGRSRRVPTAAQRNAVIARDRTCVGCAAPANRCQIHHIRWWRHHGTTDLNNLTLLCWSCHHNVHHNNWTITRQPDGGYTALPPDRADPADRRDRPDLTDLTDRRHSP
ncbi:MAG: HNH endonuclease [Actinomycetota bacterium]|nr:HNH endonuclease [Actinomycetota bacterium]